MKTKSEVLILKAIGGKKKYQRLTYKAKRIALKERLIKQRNTKYDNVQRMRWVNGFILCKFLKCVKWEQKHEVESGK